MKKTLSAILAVTVLFSPVYCQTTFEKTFGGAENDIGYSVQQTNDNGYIIAGWTESFGPENYNGYIIKTDPNGDTLWTKFFGGIGWDDCYSVQQTSDDGYIIAGGAESFSGAYDVYLIRTDDLGDTLWTKTIGGFDADRGYSMQITNDGGFIITGTTWSFGAGMYDVYLIKTNAVGDVLWSKTYGGAYGDYGNSVQQTNDDGYIITGMTENYGAGSEDVYLIKTDAAGDTLWTRTFGGTSNDYGNSVKQTSDDGYIITGLTYSFGAGYVDIYLIKTDAAGDTLWTKTFGGTNVDYGKSVQQTIDGGYIITGMIYNPATGSGDVCLIKTNSDGDTLWTKTFGGVGADIGNYVQQTNDDGFIIAGQTESSGAGLYDAYLIKTNVDGVVVPVKEITDEQNRFTIFPNPATDKLTIEIEENATLEILNIQSQIVDVIGLTEKTNNLDISKLSDGVYTLLIRTDKGIAIRKLIKQ